MAALKPEMGFRLRNKRPRLHLDSVLVDCGLHCLAKSGIENRTEGSQPVVNEQLIAFGGKAVGREKWGKDSRRIYSVYGWPRTKVLVAGADRPQRRW